MQQFLQKAREFLIALIKDNAMLKQLEKALDENVHERKALQLAMQEEQDLLKKSAHDRLTNS